MHTVIYKKDVPSEIRRIVQQFDTEGILGFIPDSFNLNIGVIYDDDNRIIGLGITRAITEFKIILDHKTPKISRVKGMKLLLKQAIQASPCNEHIAVLTQNVKPFERFLKKEFGFYRSDGIPLRLEE